MYFREYILPQWYYLVSIIILLCSMYYFLYRIFAARKFKVRKRIGKRNFNLIFAFTAALIIMSISVSSNNNINIFFAIISIAQGLWLNDYNFIVDEGLFIKGRFISWSKIRNLNYKDDKTAELSYFKNNQNDRVSKMTFNIDYYAKLALEDALERKQVITNISSWENEDITQSFKSVKRGIALALIFVIMIFAYVLYSLVQPIYLEVVLEKSFNHEKISTLVIHYPTKVKDENMPFGNMSTTSKEQKINIVKNYLNSFSIRKIQSKDIQYKFINQEAYNIILYDLDGNEAELYISKKEPVIEIISKNKKRSYYIEEGYSDIDFINKLAESIK